MSSKSTTSTTSASTSIINSYTLFLGFVVSVVSGIMIFAPTLMPVFITSIFSSQWIKDNPYTSIIIVMVIMIMLYLYYIMSSTK